MARDVAGGDVVVRRVPDRGATLKDDDLRRLVLDPGSRGDLLGKEPLRPHIHHMGLDARMLPQKGLDLIQGRTAGWSGGAVFVQEADLHPEEIIYVPLRQDPSHASSMRRVDCVSAWCAIDWSREL
jgi:hypothetical protein